MYPQLNGNPAVQPYRPPYSGTSSVNHQPPNNHHTTVVVQPTPVYGGYHGGVGGGGSSLAGVGLGLAGGALLGGNIKVQSIVYQINYSLSRRARVCMGWWIWLS
jgi:hypothetical protein